MSVSCDWCRRAVPLAPSRVRGSPASQATPDVCDEDAMRLVAGTRMERRPYAARASADRRDLDALYVFLLD